LLNKAIAFVSWVSTYIQIIAKIETKGNEARNAPKKELRLANSEMPAMSNDDIPILRIK
jgi:hypothetical protein